MKLLEGLNDTDHVAVPESNVDAVCYLYNPLCNYLSSFVFLVLYYMWLRLYLGKQITSSDTSTRKFLRFISLYVRFITAINEGLILIKRIFSVMRLKISQLIQINAGLILIKHIFSAMRLKISQLIQINEGLILIKRIFSAMRLKISLLIQMLI